MLLDELPSDKVQHNLQLMQQLVLEDDPLVEIADAPVDTALYYSALFTTFNQQQVVEAMKVLQIGRALQDPEGTSPKLLDLMAANWFLKRREATRAEGEIYLVLPRPVVTGVPRNAPFTHGGVTFRSITPVTGRMRGGPHFTQHDRELLKHAAGWLCPVQVRAEVAGSAGNLAKNTPFKYGAGRHNCFAANDFVGGKDGETNKELLDRLIATVTRGRTEV